MQRIVDSNTDKDGGHANHNQRYLIMYQTHESKPEEETKSNGYQDIQQSFETAESIKQKRQNQHKGQDGREQRITSNLHAIPNGNDWRTCCTNHHAIGGLYLLAYPVQHMNQICIPSTLAAPKRGREIDQATQRVGRKEIAVNLHQIHLRLEIPKRSSDTIAKS